MNLKDLFQSLRDGKIEAVKKELLRYGLIVSDYTTDNEHGAFRSYTIRFEARLFYINMHNGDTKSISVNGIKYI